MVVLAADVGVQETWLRSVTAVAKSVLMLDSFAERDAGGHNTRSEAWVCYLVRVI